MKAQLAKLQESIDARVIRERVLLFLTLLAFVFMVWNYLVQAPLDKERAKANTALNAIGMERKSIETQITSMTMAAANSPVIAKRKEIKQLTQNIQEVEARLATMSQGLISADQLPQMLEAMLKKIGELELVSIKTLPAVQLQLSKSSTETTTNTAEEIQEGAGSESEGAGVFKHMVVVRISGGYFELMELLTALESLSWKFYWEALDYRVESYPNAEIELRVFTLSSEEGLLGV